MRFGVNAENADSQKLDACRAYARMMNTLCADHLEPFLADDVIYESQWVCEAIHGKLEYLIYIKEKLGAIKLAGARVWAQIAYTDVFSPGPCVVLAQDAPDQLVATLLIRMDGGKIKRVNMCGVPSPQECRLTGEMPT